jgi:hypothetical protein
LDGGGKMIFRRKKCIGFDSKYQAYKAVKLDLEQWKERKRRRGREKRETCHFTVVVNGGSFLTGQVVFFFLFQYM